MLADRIDAQLQAARSRVIGWVNDFTPDQRAVLAQSDVAQTIDRLSYLDGWRRIRRTTPMILKAIERFDALGDREAVQFWIDHLDEEGGHDTVMRDDLVRMFGSESAFEQTAAANPITPPSAAVVGYFEWQVTQGDPDLLIGLRIFLEWFVANMAPAARGHLHSLVEGGSQTLALHFDADQNHLQPCYDYIERRFQADRVRTLQWSIDFAAVCLSEAQGWVANAALGRQA